MATEGPYLSVEDIARELKVDVRVVQRLIRSKKLPAHRIGKEYRIAQRDFDEYMRQTRTTDGDDLVDRVAC